jgi:hypothetical protein
MVINSGPSVPYNQNLPDLKPISSLRTKNWNGLQFLVRGNENGVKSGRFWSSRTEGPEFVVTETIL